MPEQFTTKDKLLTVLVGIFWIIGIIVVLLSKGISRNKKFKIIGYGTVLAIVLSIVVGLLQS